MGEFGGGGDRRDGREVARRRDLPTASAAIQSSVISPEGHQRCDPRPRFAAYPAGSPVNQAAG